jgi:hypothetical protein
MKNNILNKINKQAIIKKYKEYFTFFEIINMAMVKNIIISIPKQSGEIYIWLNLILKFIKETTK